jgi:hypothetical protein
MEAGWYGWEYTANTVIANVVGYLDWYYYQIGTGIIYLNKFGAIWKVVEGNALVAIGNIMEKFSKMLELSKKGLQWLGVDVKTLDFLDPEYVKNTGQGLITSGKNESQGYNDEISQRNAKTFGEFVSGNTYGQVAADAKDKMMDAMRAYESQSASKGMKTWFESVEKAAIERSQKVAAPAAAITIADTMPDVAAALGGAVGGSATGVRAGTFQQIDRSRMSIKGLAMQGETKVKDPQLATTNSLLQKINNQLTTGAVAVVG